MWDGVLTGLWSWSASYTVMECSAYTMHVYEATERLPLFVFVAGAFNPNYKLTIGVDFSLKTLSWDAGTRINLQLW